MGPQLPTWTPPRPTPWRQFRREPAVTLARHLHDRRPPLKPPLGPPADPTRAITVVCLSDTHLTQPHVPDGDLVLHTGDVTNTGSFEELQAQLDWLASLPHRHKVVIAGNHDRLLDAEHVARFPDRICETEGASRADIAWHDLVYLDRSSATLEFANGRRVTVFGSPWTPQLGTFAFRYPPVQDIWTGAVPAGTDVLLTHGGYLDLGGKGCPNLAREMARTRPRLAVFGHIHAGRGRQEVGYRRVEGGYQRVMAGDGGLGAVAGMAFGLVGAWVARLAASALRPGGGRETTTTTTTTKVNAAVGGGGPEPERRRSVTVLDV